MYFMRYNYLTLRVYRIEATYSFSNKCANTVGERASDDAANSYRVLKIETKEGNKL